MEDINKQELKRFILEASRATYASGDQNIKQKEIDGSTTIQYQNENYKYHDNYFGGEPYGGREVIFLNNKAVWMMVYYGLVYKEEEAKNIYPFLMLALSNSDSEMPYRGPAIFEKDGLKYENKLEGEVERFVGIEKIYNGDVCVYEASYVGGLVDR